MTTKAVELHHLHGQVISQAYLAKFCRSNHISRLSLLPPMNQDLTRTSDPQRMLVQFDVDHLPGKFAFLFLAIEFTTMVGRRVDLSMDFRASGPGAPSRLDTEGLVYPIGLQAAVAPITASP
jgi:hypothetical protein